MSVPQAGRPRRRCWIYPARPPLPGLILWRAVRCWACRAAWTGCGEGQVGPKMLPRHARPLAAERPAGRLAAGRRAGRLAVGRWAGQIAERGLARRPAKAGGPPPRQPADDEATRANARRDPLLDPLAITEHCVIGDQIRLPATCCEIPDCGAEFVDPAALGEADNRARTLTAGWRVDAYGRLACPACQQRHGANQPQEPGPGPDAGGSSAPAAVPPSPSDGGSPSAPPRPRNAGSPSVRAKVSGLSSAVNLGRHSRAPWLHVLAALASGNNGWEAPQPVTVPRGTGSPGNPDGPQTGAA